MGERQLQVAGQPIAVVRIEPASCCRHQGSCATDHDGPDPRRSDLAANGRLARRSSATRDFLAARPGARRASCAIGSPWIICGLSGRHQPQAPSDGPRAPARPRPMTRSRPPQVSGRGPAIPPGRPPGPCAQATSDDTSGRGAHLIRWPGTNIRYGTVPSKGPGCSTRCAEPTQCPSRRGRLHFLVRDHGEKWIEQEHPSRSPVDCV
jgi:hypothetical protein